MSSSSDQDATLSQLKPIHKFKYSKSILFLPIMLLLLFVTANLPSQTFIESVRRALGFAIAASIITGCMFLPDGLIHRPSKYLWKGVTGISFFYLAALVYLLYLDKISAKLVIHTYLDPNLQFINYEEVSYGEDCRLIVHESSNKLENLTNAFFDLFAVAHFLGWFFKTLICRDLKLVLFASISFEMIEYGLRNVLNNFKECWWDHIIVDMLGCNLLGIMAGFYVIDKFKMERYRWSLRMVPMQNSLWVDIKYFFTHWNLSNIEAKAFSSLKKFVQIAYFILFFQANDISLFFLKYVYGIPPSNFICIGRVWIVGLLCVNAAKEYYDFVVHRVRHIRVNSFLANFIIYTEIFIVWKQGKGDFEHAFIDRKGLLFLAILAAIFCILFLKILISDLIILKHHLSSQGKRIQPNILSQPQTHQNHS